MARASPPPSKHQKTLWQCHRLTRLCRVLVLLMGVLLATGVTARAAPPNPDNLRLMLEVFINGDPTNLIAEFRRSSDGRFSSKRSELREIGINVPKGRDEDMIEMDSLPGIGLRYDEQGQKLHVTISPEMRLAREYSASEGSGFVTKEKTEISRDIGGVLNYGLYGTATRGYSNSSKIFQTGSLTLDHRVFSPLGVLQNSAIAGTTLAKKGLLRLDTSFVYAHPDTMTMVTAGDVISGGLNWTRPVRYGGGQISRSFSLRPDLVTAPLPSVAGSAAVPSTVDVFVDNIRVASREVSAGPFRLNNIPVPGESGTARVVVRDVTGRETVTSVPFFTSSKLLSAGEFDFSFDGGVPRYNYAIESFDYGKKWIGMGTARYGLTERLTIEGHGEATPGLANGGAGLTFGAGTWGTITMAGAASWYNSTLGGLVHGSWQNTIKGVFVGMSTQRTFGKYQDVASVTAKKTVTKGSDDLTDSGYFVLNRSSGTPKAMDRLTVGVPLPKWNASFAASFINLERADGDKSHLISLTYSQTFNKKYNAFISAFTDLASHKTAGVTAGLSFQLGDDMIVSGSINGTRESKAASLEVTRPLGTNAHDYGWRVFTNEGTNVQRGATATYRNPWSQIGAGIRQDKNFIGGYGELDGAIVATTNGILPSRRVSDAFAIVDAGAPGIEVLHENRPVGYTNWFGKAVVPDLRSLQRSKIAISPETVPAGNYVTLTETDVIPGYRGAANVRVKSIAAQDTARVVIHDEKGEPMPLGTVVTLKETGATFGLGYGGMTFIPGIGDSNTLHVQNGEKSCEVSFSREERRGNLGRVGPLVCKGG